LIRFLSEHLKEIEPLASKTLNELGLDECIVSCIEEDSTLTRAFQSILETGYAGFPVVDEKGKLVNSFSASDLKRIKNIKGLDFNLTVSELLQQSPMIPLARCSPDSTLGQVISLAAKEKVHRIFVIDTEGKPVSVVSLTSLLRVFNHPGSVSFA